MPTLNWIGKESVVNHDKAVPFRLLKKVKAHSVGENSQNLIIHGDNLEALKALMPFYAGKIKCIYIDPPYNTGNESWVYNDKVNSPKIKKWLGKVVGGEAEDLCRHDKWLCMMYPRLKLLRELLSDDGVIFVSIGKDEVSHLQILVKDVFGDENFIEIMSREQKSGSNQGTFFAPQLDYIIVASKNSKHIRHFLVDKKEIDSISEKSLYQSSLDPLRGCTNQRYWIKCPDGSYVIPPGDIFPKIGDSEKIKPSTRNDKVWRWSQVRYLAERKNIIFKETSRSPLLNEHKKPSKWNVYSQNKNTEGMLPRDYIFGFTNSIGTKEMELLGLKDKFDNSKPSELIAHLISIMNADKEIFILDSFAGSGTTAHAVMQLNKEDGGDRKFILVEMEDYAKDITAERVKRAIQKYDYKDGFEFCELDKPLFNEGGKIEPECTYEQLATYVYFTETNTNINKKSIDNPFIGEYNDTEYYLLFKSKGKNVLNKDFLKRIPKHNRKKIIYADKCLVDEKIMEKQNIIFKQIPYEVRIY